MAARAMKNRPNYYRILQVQPDALPEIINASYRTIMRKLKKHPDLGGSTEEAALLNEAYETLSSPRLRTAYDEELFHQSIQASRSYVKRPLSSEICLFCKSPQLQKPAPDGVCPTCRTPLPSDEPQEPGRAGRRSLERTKISDSVYYYSSWPGEAREGRMIDFSPKGMRFICSELLAIGSILKISSRLFEALGSITNVSEEEAGGQKSYSMGVFFLAVRFEESRGTFLSTSA